MFEQQDQSSVMSSPTLFIHLIYKMGNLEDATVVHVLLAKKAHVTPWQTSAREISSLLGSTVSRLSVQRCIDRLKHTGMIKTRVSPNRFTEISLSQLALIEVMQKPLPVSSHGFIPGISNVAIPLLSDPEFLQAISTTAQVAEFTEPVKSNNDQTSAAMEAMH